MLDKIKSGLNLFILFMFAVSIVYGIIIIIFSAFNGEKTVNSYLSKQNVDIYMTEEALVTRDYSTFFTIEKCIQDVVTTLNSNDVNAVYNILTNDAKAQINNDKNKLTEYYNNNFKFTVLPDMFIDGYQNSDNLKKLYKIENDTYICVVTSIDEDKLTNIGIRIKGSQYKIFYIEV